MWYGPVFDDDFERKVRATQSSGLVNFNYSTNQLEAKLSGRYFTNWLFFGNSINCRNCFLWHEIYHKYFNLVPQFCRFNCYKVVVFPRDCAELIQLWQTFHSLPAQGGYITMLAGKCGIDTRDYTPPAYPNRPGKYSAYIYANNLKFGLIYYRIIRKLIDDMLSTEIKVILKRSCTEFEQSLGPTDNAAVWDHMTPAERELEMRLDDIYSVEVRQSLQPDWLKNRTILQQWVKHARVCGDLSGNESAHDDPYAGLVQAVTYHQKLYEEEPGAVRVEAKTPVKKETKNGSGSNSRKTKPKAKRRKHPDEKRSAKVKRSGSSR